MAVRCGGNLAIDLVDGLGIIADGVDRRPRLGLLRHADLGAIVPHPQNGQRQCIGRNQIGPFQQHRLARHWRHIAPDTALKALPRRGDGCLGIGFRPAGDAGKGLAVDWRNDLHCRF
ncbi:MAG: Uncharacterised protein [SAR116 cluster bacterium]|nr:MAG: Uncharacterised protein [SAR116 cluster bacterium]